jgi:hypothetical protein
MNIANIPRVALRGLSTTQEITQNPFNFVIDNVIRLIVKVLLPVPLASELIIYFKGPILALFAGVIIFFITLIFIIYSMVFTPLSQASTLSNLLQAGQPLTQNIQELNGYIDQGFSDTNTPAKDPFGGSGTDNMTITVNYHEVESFEFDGSGITETEQGIDIIPSGTYYATNKAYKLTGQPIIFDTLTGTTNTYVDQYGANIIEVTNTNSTVKTVYIHMSQVLVGNGVTVRPGQPIGIMGSTGMSTGPHLEYQVRLNSGGSWVTQNPLTYIN